jgi:hypothetical protein
MTKPMLIALGEFNPDTLLLPALCFLLMGFALCASLRIVDSFKARQRRKARIVGVHVPLIE